MEHLTTASAPTPSSMTRAERVASLRECYADAQSAAHNFHHLGMGLTAAEAEATAREAKRQLALLGEEVA